MAEQYILWNDIIDNHSLRMDNLKKYYPFFKLQETTLTQYKDGRFADIDMGYITLASLRFFIDENNFNDRRVDFTAYRNFLMTVLTRDFDLKASTLELEDLIAYIFDKIKNDGKPFYFSYFDPTDKKKKTSRLKLIDSEIENGVIYYRITTEGVEFYLETKEVRDESKISIQQLLLEKMITSNNYRGGIEVVRRINGEVSRMALKKQEVIKILESDVYEGAAAYDRYMKQVARWFDEEEKLFKKNHDLINKALSKAEGESQTLEGRDKYFRVLKEINALESELKKTIERHGRLIIETMELAKVTDEFIGRAKLKRLRPVFDFESELSKLEEMDDVRGLKFILEPLFMPHPPKEFALTNIDHLLNARPDKTEATEKVVKEEEVKDYISKDEIEEQRINSNFHDMFVELLEQIKRKHDITLSELNGMYEVKFGKEILKNGDYYTFLVHLVGKREYSVKDMLSKQDTFMDGIVGNTLTQEERERYQKMEFRIELNGQELTFGDAATVTDMKFIRTDI